MGKRKERARLEMTENIKKSGENGMRGVEILGKGTKMSDEEEEGKI